MDLGFTPGGAEVVRAPGISQKSRPKSTVLCDVLAAQRCAAAATPPSLRMAYDVLIIGSGPGGASVARDLARAGRQVLVLERNRDWRAHRLYGTYPGALLYADRNALLFTKQGLNVIRP